MRIKKFIHFINENLSFVDVYDDEEVRNTIKDIFIDLEDSGIGCDISINDPDMDESNILRIIFSDKNDEGSINTSLFKDSIPMLIDYLEEIKPKGTTDFYRVSYNYYNNDTRDLYYHSDSPKVVNNLSYEDKLPEDADVAWLIVLIDIIDLDWIKKTGRDED